jgi:hypothetical protein
MTTNDANVPLVPAAFDNRDTATAAIEALLQAGIDRADIGVAIPVREASRIRDESGQDALKGAAVGAAVGGRLGMLGGIVLAAVTVGSLGIGGFLLAGAGGLLWGGTVGGLIGVVTRVRRQPDVDRWCELELGDDSVLVVVRVRDWSHEPEIAALLTRAGAVQILDRTDLDHTWRELEVEHPTGQPEPRAA